MTQSFYFNSQLTGSPDFLLHLFKFYFQFNDFFHHPVSDLLSQEHDSSDSSLEQNPDRFCLIFPVPRRAPAPAARISRGAAPPPAEHQKPGGLLLLRQRPVRAQLLGFT